jgi:hypothetical protein
MIKAIPPVFVQSAPIRAFCCVGLHYGKEFDKNIEIPIKRCRYFGYNSAIGDKQEKRVLRNAGY